jgi:hypothetical protein
MKVFAVKPPQILIICLPLFLCFCAAPSYDDDAYKKLTNLQSEVDLQIQKNIRGAGTDGDYTQKTTTDWYSTVNSDLDTLENQMEGSGDPSTANLPVIFQNMRIQLDNLEVVHKTHGRLPPTFWSLSENQLNSQFAVLITYELSLKNGGAAATKSTATTTAAAKSAGPPKR